jgi:hypothetical protein
MRGGHKFSDLYGDKVREGADFAKEHVYTAVTSMMLNCVFLGVGNFTLQNDHYLVDCSLGGKSCVYIMEQRTYCWLAERNEKFTLYFHNIFH